MPNFLRVGRKIIEPSVGSSMPSAGEKPYVSHKSSNYAGDDLMLGWFAMKGRRRNKRGKSKKKEGVIEKT